MSAEDNKRVAKNAIALTLRMLLVTIVGLYTSRIVLEALGVDDYGIYGVIGGVVGMASFLNTSMAGATSRFITYELGRKNLERLQRIFSSALIIHVLIAVVVAILAETIGLWFVNYKMNFPPDRMFAVNVLYQFTILSMLVNFTQVPYNAAIIAHERMNIYAYIEIINVVLKLLIVYLLLIVNTDRLILYAALSFAVSVGIAMLYRVYCVSHFSEARFHFIWDKTILRDLLTFSGFDLYGNMCNVAKNQGTPIILNLFYGVVANTGAAVALTVTGAIQGLTTSILHAFRPQIIKQYSVGNLRDSELAARRGAQFTDIAYSIIAIPIFIETATLIGLWLGTVPQYSVVFVRYIIIISIVGVVITANNTCIQATGNIKYISFISGSFYLLCPVVSYFWMRSGGPATAVYIVEVICFLIVTFLGWYFIHKQIPIFHLREYAFLILRSWLSILISGVLVMLIFNSFSEKCYSLANGITFYPAIMRLIIVSALSIFVSIPVALLIALNKSERHFLYSFVGKLYHRIIKA